MGYRRVFIIRKDLHLSSGKLAAMVAHCAEAYWTNLIRKNITKKCINDFPTKTLFWDRWFYERDDINQFCKEAYENGEDVFYLEPVDISNPNGELKLGKARYEYKCKLEDINPDIYEQYINGSFVKIICQARNKNHLLKSKEIAKELGLVEEADFGEINDKCLTELTPENEDGTTLVGIWFKPLPDEVAHKISKKYHLYMD